MSYSLKGFSLDGAHPALHEQARRAARRGDPLGIFGCADSNSSVSLFEENFNWFCDNDLFEKALLAAWTNQKCVPRWYRDEMKKRLQDSSRAALMKYSDPLPKSKTFTVYRGVREGDPRGVSWTLDLNIARRFADLFGLGGTVYKTTVKRSDVYAYVGDVTGWRGEKEVLLVLDDDHPIEVVEVIERKPD